MKAASIDDNLQSKSNIKIINNGNNIKKSNKHKW